MIFMRKPVRLLGAPHARIVLNFGEVLALHSPLCLERLSIVSQSDSAPCSTHGCECGGVEPCLRGLEWEEFSENISPALSISDKGFLLARSCYFNSTTGSAIVINDAGSAFLDRCELSSHVGDWINCLGVCAKDGVALSMYECRVHHTRWGVFAGPDGRRLLDPSHGNVFEHNEEEDVTTGLYSYTEQKVQVWAPRA